MAAARHVFLDGPPEQATMDAVAQRAGMSKKTIYREFKSQLELLAALLVDSAADLGEVAPPSPRSDVEMELCALLVRIMTHITSSRSMALVRLIVSEIRRYPELMKQQKPKSIAQQMIVDFLEAPAVRTRYQIEDAEEAAAMLFGMVMQDTGLKLLFVDGALPQHLIEQRARKAVGIFLRGVRKGP